MIYPTMIRLQTIIIVKDNDVHENLLFDTAAPFMYFFFSTMNKNYSYCTCICPANSINIQFYFFLFYSF